MDCDPASARPRIGGDQHAAQEEVQLERQEGRHRKIEPKTVREHGQRQCRARCHKRGRHPAHPPCQQHQERKRRVELHLEPQAPVRQRRAKGIVGKQAEHEAHMRRDIGEAHIGIAFARLERLPRKPSISTRSA